MKKIFYSFFAVIGYLGIMFFIVSKADVLEVGEAFSIITWPVILVVLGMACIHMFLRALRWHWLSLEIKAEVTWKESFYIFANGSILSLVTPGRAGEAIKTVFLKKHGVKMTESIGIVIIERVLDLLALLVFVLVFLQSALEINYKFLYLGIGLVLSMVMFLLVDGLRVFIFKLIKGCCRGCEKLIEIIGNVETGFAIYKNKGYLFIAHLGMSLVIWFIDFIKLFVLFKMVGIVVPVGLVLFAYPFSLMMGVFSFMPFAEGVISGSLIYTLKVFGGVGLEFATAMILVDRLLSVLPAMGFASIFNLIKKK